MILKGGDPTFTPQIVIPGWTAGEDVLFSQIVFTYDFEFLHDFLRNKKKDYASQKIGGTPPSLPKFSFLGGQQAKCLHYEYPPRRTHIFLLSSF